MAEYQFHCRKMEEQDIPAVVEIEKQLFARPWSKQAFLQALEQDTLYVVVLERDVVVGYCGMYCSFEEGEITNVAIAPERQNQGIGHKMLEYLLEQAYQKGISYIVLEVRISNINAIHLYESMGFQNRGIRKNFYEMPKEDGMIMVLES